MRLTTGSATTFAALLALVLSAAVPDLLAQQGADEPLPTDPALLTGTLDNGLRYVIARHANPEGHLSLWLHVHAGSLDETEEERGLAHYLEHMAFNGSANFAPGALVPFFQSLGLSFGRDQNAFTSYVETTYQLALPDVRPETIDPALLFLADVASRLTLAPAEIEAERQIILEEKRARGGPQRRVADLVGERLAPESTYGRRAPIGTEASIRALTPQKMRDFYARWYAPENMTLLAVGDADPKRVAERIARAFGGAPKAPRLAPLPVGVRASQGQRAIVASDPEITAWEVALTKIAPPRGPLATMSTLRREVLDQLAARCFNRRSHRLGAAGKVGYLSAEASSREVPASIRTVEARCRCDTRQWRRDLLDFATVVQRARRHGFSDREVADAKALLIADAEEAVERDAARTTREVIRALDADVTAGGPMPSAAQRLDILRRVVPGITPADVAATFAARFDPADAVFVLTLPAGDDVPKEEEFLALAHRAFETQPEAEPEPPRPTQLLAAEPPGGKAAETSEDAASGVSSLWLENGVRVHHRLLHERPGEIVVALALAGGRIQETAADRGLHEAAILPWQRLSAGPLSSVDLRDVLIGRKIHVRAAAGEDVLSLTIRTGPEDLAEAMRLAYLLLTEPTVEGRALGGWKSAQAQSVAARRFSAQGVLSELANATLHPGDPRRQPLTGENLRALSARAAQARIRDLVRTAPLEAAIVGDVPRDSALALATRYLGSLPARARISPRTLADLRAAKHAPGPVAAERKIDARTDRAQVTDGFFAADAADLDDARRLELAARILTTRMTRSIREEKQLVYSIRAMSSPAVAYPGLGTFMVSAPTDPAKAGALAAALDAAFAAFAQDGPTDDEVAVARVQVANQFDERLRQVFFWADLLSTLDYRGRDLARVIGAAEAYRKMGTAEVKAAFAKYCRPESRFRFVVLPDPAAAAPPIPPPGPDEGDPEDPRK